MFGYASRLGVSSSVHTEDNTPPMSWEATLACFGSVIGIVIFIYLLCRWCHYMDPIQNPQERRENLGELILGDEAPVVVRRTTVVPMLPSADAEPQYYSRR